MTHGRILQATQVYQFILSGNAVFTIKSLVSGKHYTYKVKAKDDIWFVTFLGGEVKGKVRPAQWHYMGNIVEDQFSKNRKVPAYVYHHDAFRGFEWFWEILKKGRLPQDAEFYHMGKCGMCGRKLTDPISVTEGYGPECRGKLLQRSFRVE